MVGRIAKSTLRANHLKGTNLKTILTTFTVVVLAALAGCKGVGEGKEPVSEKEKLSREGKVLLTVDFEPGKPLQYKFVSSREVEINWDPTGESSRSRASTVNKHTESVEMVVAYTPTEVDPYGLTTIKATCKTVKATRSRRPSGRAGGKDAVEYARGKTFTFTVGPTGKMEGNSQLDKLIREIGEKVFRPDDGTGRRIKEPDMIGDFVASQWFLWDSISSIQKPSEGVAVGQTWKSKLSVPTPMVMRKARDVTYTLSQVRQSEGGQVADIHSTYSLAESAPSTWPIPYSGRFMMAGTFGFLRGYKIQELTGEGEELFNIDAGRIERHSQQYQMRMSAFVPLGIDASPQVTIKQKLTMQLLK